ncbi:hypothetical protein [Sphingorhabdus sp. 109]|uniref:hypothetical protein n=1 Tax=Sphingorhabdus sp. 109 TaxID=2653173 RepID=UPI0012F2B8BD|nr:hypothetical protein [Sphingorhabdus sp. 109]VWX62572.1 conserved hypothetical protein [Sphingorhabdus sp. 109]
MADGDIDQSDFAVAFTFARPLAAAYRDANGDSQSAAIDTPRFDHDSDGNPLGLLVEGGPYLGQADRTLIDPLMLPENIVGEEVTILHSMTDIDGTIIRRAWYSRDAIAMINGLLAIAGRHAEIGLIAGFRENKGEPDETGYVRYRGQSWHLVPLISATGGVFLADAAGRPLIGG